MFKAIVLLGLLSVQMQARATYSIKDFPIDSGRSLQIIKTIALDQPVNWIFPGPKNGKILVVMQDWTAKLFDPGTGTFQSGDLGTLTNKSIGKKIWSPDERYLHIEHADSARLVDVQTLKSVVTIPLEKNDRKTSDWSRNGRYFLTSRWEDLLKVWRIYDMQAPDSPRVIKQRQGSDDLFFSTAPLSDDRFAAFGFWSGAFPLARTERGIAIMDISTGRVVHRVVTSTLKDETLSLESPSPDGKYFLVKNTIQYSSESVSKYSIWSFQFENGKPVLKEDVLIGALNIESAEWSPDSKNLALKGTRFNSSLTENIEIWSTQSKTRLHSFVGGQWKDRSLGWSNDGKLLQTARDRWAVVFDLESQTQILSDYTPGALGLDIGVTFTSNGKLVSFAEINKIHILSILPSLDPDPFRCPTKDEPSALLSVLHINYDGDLSDDTNTYHYLAWWGVGHGGTVGRSPVNWSLDEDEQVSMKTTDDELELKGTLEKDMNSGILMSGESVQTKTGVRGRWAVHFSSYSPAFRRAKNPMEVVKFIAQCP